MSYILPFRRYCLLTRHQIGQVLQVIHREALSESRLAPPLTGFSHLEASWQSS